MISLRWPRSRNVCLPFNITMSKSPSLSTGLSPAGISQPSWRGSATTPWLMSRNPPPEYVTVITNRSTKSNHGGQERTSGGGRVHDDRRPSDQRQDSAGDSAQRPALRGPGPADPGLGDTPAKRLFDRPATRPGVFWAQHRREPGRHHQLHD